MYRFAQFHQHVVVVFSARDHLRLAADHEGSGRSGAQGARQPDDLDRVHPVGVERDHSIFLDLRLDEVDGARLPVTRGGVDEDDQVVIFVQGIGEIHPANTEVHDLDTLGQPASGEALHHLDAETVVPRNMLPMPAIRTRLLIGNLEVQWLELLGREEEPVPEEAFLSQVPPRVVLQRYRDVDPLLVILLYALDERDLSLESHVHDIPSGARPEQDPTPLPELDAAYGHALKCGSLLIVAEKVLHPTLSASGCPGRFRSAS